MLHTTAQLIIREVRDWWTYTGDGDTKTYQEVCKSKPYENVEIVKAECIGHVQKCVGSRLRSLKEKYKNQVLSDGKKMFGKRWLTKKPINTLQNCYGMAIRQNIGSLYEMKKSVAAVLFHCSEDIDITNQDFAHVSLNHGVSTKEIS